MNVEDQWLINFAWLIISVCSVMAHQLFCESQIPHRQNRCIRWHVALILFKLEPLCSNMYNPDMRHMSPNMFSVICLLFADPHSHLARDCNWVTPRKETEKSKFVSPRGRPILQSLQISRWLMHWLLCEGEASYLLPRCFRIRRRIIPGDSQPGVCSASQEGLWVVGFNIWF